MNEYKLVFFDFEVFKYDWLVVFNFNNQEEVIVNDCDKLKNFINRHSDHFFIGFNNYHYDDIICHKIIEGENPYEINNRIIENKEKIKIKDYLYKSLDLMQDLKITSLKKIMANLGLNIIECPVNFKLERKLTEEELDTVINYCKNDVSATKFFYQFRKKYFETKLGIINDFNLDEKCIMYTENRLTTEILNPKEYSKCRDELIFNYCNDLNFEILPKEVLDFYGDIEYRYFNYDEYSQLSKKKLDFVLLGCPTRYGLGGIHSALKNITEHGNILQIDFSSFYPSIMINYDFFSRAITEKDIYIKIYNDRIALKQIDVEKSNRFKLILNKPYGCMKNKYHILRDFRRANEITINGQLIITQLVIELKEYIKLIQTNTDSITFKYEKENYVIIKKIIDNFCDRFGLGYSECKIKSIYQINVNNYIIVDENNLLKCKGSLFKNYNPLEHRDVYKDFNKFDQKTKEYTDLYNSNSLSIIDKCLVENLVYGRTVEDVVYESYNNNEIDRFQLVVTYGQSFDSCILIYDGKQQVQQKVCRVFATKDTRYGEILKHRNMNLTKNVDYENEYEKIPRSFKHNFVFNDSLDKFPKEILDLDYYIKICKENIIEKED